jgi:hypothetical protein
MLLSRLAAALIILSQVILLLMLSDMTGSSATTFSFFGHPLLGLGLLLALVSIVRRGDTG